MRIWVFEAKSKAELEELASQSGPSIADESRSLGQENQSANQEDTSKVSTATKLSIMLNYVLDLSNYMLDLSNYAGMSNMPSNACIASCLL